MALYTHALVLIHNETDGLTLVNHVAGLAETLGSKLTLCHLSDEYHPLNYVFDNHTGGDGQSEALIEANAMLNRVAEMAALPADIAELVTIRQLKDVETFVDDNGIDVVIAGHKNRVMGTLTSWSAEFINHLSVDVLVHHL
jgi:universal stress protein A